MRNITDTTDPTVKKGVDKRIVGLVLAFVGAGCLIVAAVSKSWMGNPSFSGLVRDRDGNVSAESGKYMPLRGDIRFGPTGFEHCAKPYRGFEMHESGGDEPIKCTSMSTGELNTLVRELDRMNADKYTSGAFAPAGWAALITCLVAAIGLLVSAGLVLARKRKELPVSPASVALLGVMGAMAAGCVFIATKPGPAGMLGVDIGFWAFGAGTVLGIVGAQMLAKELRPPDEDLLEGAMNPDDFSQFPTSFARPATAPAPSSAGESPYAPPSTVPTTEPVAALVGEVPGGAEVGDSLEPAKKPDDVS